MWQGLGNDPGRDMLVAKHLVDGEAGLKRGPFANGGLGWLLNSPRYYWVIATMWAVSGSPYTVTLLWAVITSLSIPLGYYVGKKYFNSEYLGILFASFLAVHPRLVYLSHYITQPNFTAYWGILLLLSLLATLRKPTLLKLLAFITLVAIPLHLHYAIFLLMPICFIWFVYLWHELLSEELSLANVVTPPLWGVGLFLDWIFTTYTLTPFDQVYFILLNFEKTDSLTFFEKCRQFVQNFAISWTGSRSHLAVFYSLLAISISAILVFLATKKHQIKEYFEFVAAFSLIGSLVISVLFNGSVYESYLDIFIIPTCFLLAVGFWLITRYSKLLGMTLTICLVWLWYSNNGIFFEPQKIFYTHEYVQKITTIIDDDYQNIEAATTSPKKNSPNYILYALDVGLGVQYDGWSTTSSWYLLENKYATPLIRLSEGGVNISPLATSPEYAYVICSHRGRLEEATDFCQKATKYYKQYLYQEPTLIFQDYSVLIFRYPVIPNVYIPTSRYYEPVVAKNFLTPKKED